MSRGGGLDPPPLSTGAGADARPRAARAWAAIAALVIVVTVLHYGTSFHLHGAHGIYRRLYYFPILLAAFRGGWRGGLAVAFLCCAVYLPHAFGVIGRDPAPALEKLLEMALYCAVGLVAGLLVSRAERAQRELAATAADLRRALAEKAAMESELVRSARLAAVGRLSAGLAHEIRNPLASIQGAAEVLQDDFPPAHPKGRLLRILVDEAGRLNQVLTRFLDFARPRPGRRDVVDVAREAAEAVELARHRERAPRLRGPLAATEPPAGAGWTVRGDRDQLRQLLLNVVLNAVEAAGADGVVTVTLAAAGAEIAVAVEDDGPGFAPEAIASLGEPFATTKPGGTGLGLAICLRIAEDHGGRLAAENRPGGGARVTLTLPAA